MTVKALDLFEAYTQNMLSPNGAYIISLYLDDNSLYSIFEIVAYRNIKAVYFSNNCLSFPTNNNKLYILVEPPAFPHKDIEPLKREKGKQIPFCFTELDILTTKNKSKIMINKEPVKANSSFIIKKPEGSNFSFIFYNLPGALNSLKTFFIKTLEAELHIPQSDSKKAAPLLINGLNKFTIWNS